MSVPADDRRMLWRTSASPVKMRYLEQFAAGKTALDLGTGAGHYARALKERGFRVTGLDRDPLAHFDFPFIQARLNAIPFRGPFDTVLMFDVLEHEVDEAGALRQLRRITGQRLLLSVPNGDDRLLTPYNLTYKHHVDKTHQREYLAPALHDKLEQAGFRVLRLTKEGPVHPALFAEFLPLTVLRAPARLALKALHRLGLLGNRQLMADLYAVAEPA
jgi:SAM-dependent methyltransferase